ncbi:hypothetical protein C7S18_23135 [Ahniella affigens]|uniref:Methyltransferase FkbM domain-containing protein n=2 Tax=Ahniella affigens TaxID=2021234 RepID=A0A2P1PZG1_9GAMM|nr:hypothetical protein C7S18_23135 [Ahniella affigens]
MAIAKPRSRVVAFEPSPREFARLMQMIALNHCAVQALPIGLADQSGFLPFHVCHNNFGRNTLGGFNDPESFTATLAAIATADSLVEQGLLPSPQVIKIDVEGAELAVLRGMRSILKRPDCLAIVIESDPDSDHPDSELRQLLPAAEWQLRRLQRRENTAHNLDNFLAQRVVTP